MPLTRSEKVKLSEEYAEIFEKAAGMVVFDYRGLSVEQFSDLRNKVREAGGNIRVVKNRMLKRALTGRLDDMQPILVGPSAVVFSGEEDPVTPTKALVDFAKDNEIVTIKCGAVGEDFLSPDQVEILARTPSLPELHAKILGGIKAPASNLLGLIKGSHQKIHGLFTAYAQKLEEAS